MSESLIKREMLEGLSNKSETLGLLKARGLCKIRITNINIGLNTTKGLSNTEKSALRMVRNVLGDIITEIDEMIILNHNK